jgi:Ala-tRNA(Pro) deacylase
MTIPARVADYLRERNVGFELGPHRATGSTHESAEAAHIPDDHIAKGVMVHDRQGDAMAVIPGDAWLQLDALNQETGRAFELDEESELTELFPDCEPGAVPVTGPAYGIETFVDEALTTLAFVCFEAGDHQNLVRVQGDDFVALMQGLRRGHFSGKH